MHATIEKRTNLTAEVHPLTPQGASVDQLLAEKCAPLPRQRRHRAAPIHKERAAMRNRRRLAPLAGSCAPSPSLREPAPGCAASRVTAAIALHERACRLVADRCSAKRVSRAAGVGRVGEPMGERGARGASRRPLVGATGQERV